MKIELCITCPHCNEYILIEELNCCIFRHGVLIESGKQIDPHSSEEMCNEYILHKKIVGCGKPFKIVKIENEYKAITCGYI
jgi:hypothetical protein